MRVEGMNALLRLSGSSALALHDFLALVCQGEAFDTVCKTISESLTLKFKYQDAVSVEQPETH